MVKKTFKNIQKKWGYSLVGLFIAFKEEKSLWAYLFLIVAIVITGVFAKLNFLQWSMVLFIWFIVVCIEILNTAIEATVDTISFQYNVKVKKIKDIAAAATLVATSGASISIVLIFVSAFLGVF